MKKYLFTVLVLFLLCGCSSGQSQEQQNIEIKEEENIAEEQQIEETKEEDKTPLSDNGDVIFLQCSRTNKIDLISVFASTYNMELEHYNYGNGNHDVEASDSGFYHFLEVSYNDNYGISSIEAMVNKDELCSPKRFLMGIVELAEHDSEEEYDGQTVYDWVLANMGNDADTKFGHANFHIYNSTNGDMYILDVFTDGDEWWQNKLLQEIQ